MHRIKVGLGLFRADSPAPGVSLAGRLTAGCAIPGQTSGSQGKCFWQMTILPIDVLSILHSTLSC